MREILERLRPLTFVFWGLVLVAVAYGFSTSRSDVPEESSWLATAAFPVLLVSWISGIILMIRVHLRRREGSSFSD